MAAADILPWLLTPLSGSSTHSIEPGTYWHARLMVLGWGLLLPVGVLWARYLKVLPWQDWPTDLDNKAWWHAHRALQYSGLVCTLAALAFVLWPRTQLTAAPGALHWHGQLGWLLVAMAALQVVGGVFRGSKGGPSDERLAGDHYDMTPWRVGFERLHKGLGWLAIALSVPTLLLGLVAADAPRWMALALVLWWLALAGMAIALQRRGLCIDTYQAIWGTEASLPGLHRPPIGWGVRRTPSHPWR